MRNKKKIITLCSSTSFFKQCLDAEKQLKVLGFQVKLPHTTIRKRRSGDFKVETYKIWFKDPKNYKRKAWLIKNHFKKIILSDAVLVLNYEKNGIEGYIGGNTLIEMAIAYHYKKPIYILNPVSEDLTFKEEIFGLQPIFLNGKIEEIKFA